MEQIGTSLDVVACVSQVVGVYEKDVVPDVVKRCVSVYCYYQLLVEVGGVKGESGGTWEEADDVVGRGGEVALEEGDYYGVGCVEGEGHFLEHRLGPVAVAFPEHIRILNSGKQTAKEI